VDVAEHLAQHEAVIVGLARKIAWHYRLGRHAWKDLAQEAREELIHAHNGRYDHDRASLLSYAYRGINWRLEAVAQDMIGKTNPADGLLFDELAAHGADDDVLVSDPELQSAWQQLSEGERTVLRLYAIHPTLEAASTAAGVSVPTFRRRKNEAAEKCRRLHYGEDVEITKRRRGRPRGSRPRTRSLS
jgi:DNA-directed RNA polymerase specialized sigma24 family protein